MILQEQLPNGLIKLKAAYGYIHKKGTDNYAKATIMLSGETVDMYEIVDEKPQYTKAEYDTKVNELIRGRYSESEEFAIQRKMLNAMLPQPVALSDDETVEPVDAEKAIAEYTEYNAYVEKCKLDAPQAVLSDIEIRKQIEASEQAKTDSQPDTEPIIDIEPIDPVIDTSEDERLIEELRLNVEKQKAEQAKAEEAQRKEQERLEAERLEAELEAKRKEAEQRAEAERLKAQREAEKRAEISRKIEESEKFRREYLESLKNK